MGPAQASDRAGRSSEGAGRASEEAKRTLRLGPWEEWDKAMICYPKVIEHMKWYLRSLSHIGLLPKNPKL